MFNIYLDESSQKWPPNWPPFCGKSGHLMKISILNDIIPLITSTRFQEHTLIAQVAFLFQIAGKIAMEW